MSIDGPTAYGGLRDSCPARTPTGDPAQSLRPFIPEYLQYAFTVDPNQGSVPRHLADFSLSPATSECELTAQMLRSVRRP